MSACKDSYTECNLDSTMLVRTKEIEAEVHALNAAFKWLNYEQRDKRLTEVKAIFIALEAIFSEFKDN